MEHADWPYVLLWIGLVLSLSQARASDAKLKRTQIQMRALLRHLNAADPTALPPPSAQVREALERRGKFAALKAYWDQTGASIGDCKEAVEELQEDTDRLRRRTT